MCWRARVHDASGTVVGRRHPLARTFALSDQDTFTKPADDNDDNNNDNNDNNGATINKLYVILSRHLSNLLASNLTDLTNTQRKRAQFSTKALARRKEIEHCL